MIVHNFFTQEEFEKSVRRMFHQGKEFAIDMNRLIITEFNSVDDEDEMEDQVFDSVSEYLQ
jgi:hypothetical protein